MNYRPRRGDCPVRKIHFETYRRSGTHGMIQEDIQGKEWPQTIPLDKSHTSVGRGTEPEEFSFVDERSGKRFSVDVKWGVGCGRIDEEHFCISSISLSLL